MAPPSSDIARSLDLLRLETPRLTFLFWSAIAIFTAAFFLTPYLPLIDYHQHVAVAAQLFRAFDRNSPEHALYEINLVTYNGLFHLLTALLSFTMAPLQAGRLVMAFYPALLALATLAVMREAGRPRWYAFLLLPVFYSRAMAWGFANWNLTFPFAILVLTWWLRYRRGEKTLFLWVLVGSFFCAYGHVLAMLTLCFGMGVVELFVPRETKLPQRLFSLVSSPLPILPGVLWCIAVYFYQTRASFSNWPEANYNGLDDPVWFKIWSFLDLATGNFSDKSDNGLLVLSLLLSAVLWFLARRERVTLSPKPNEHSLAERQIRTLALAFLGCYLAIPKVFVATWFIYERFPIFVLLFGIAALPIYRAKLAKELSAFAATIGFAASANTARVWVTSSDVREAATIFQSAPPKKRLLAVTFEPSTDKIKREIFVHLPAIYQTLHSGELGYSFTRFESMPLHYRPGLAPPTVPPGFEWDGHKYDPRADWARAYDLTLVCAPSEDSGDPTPRVFEQLASEVKLLTRRGRFWLYDTSSLKSSNIR